MTTDRKDIRLIALDLDGTLLNTLDDLADSANRVCAAHGWAQYTKDEYRYFVGNGIPKLVERFSPETARDPATLAATLAEFDAVYGAHMHDKTAPYPGMPELLHNLRQNGVKMAVFSNKADEFAGAVVERYFGKGLFEIVRGEGGVPGVYAPDERTVVLLLSRTDPLLLEKLAEPEAFPCRQDFYEGTHARYGNTLTDMIYNGPFTVQSWESGELRLAANKEYTGLTPAETPLVVCTLGADNTVERFLDGKTDCCRVDAVTLRQLSGDATLLTFRNGTVSLLLNRNTAQLDQTALRQALCYGFDLRAYTESGRLPAAYEYAGSIVPGAARLFDQSYIDLTRKGFALGTVTFADGSSSVEFRRSNQLSISYNARAAQAALDSLQGKLPEGLTLLLPRGSALEDFCGWLQKQWLDHLGMVVNLEIVDADTYRPLLDGQKIYFFGNGACKCMPAINHDNACLIEGIEPLARHMIPLAEKRMAQQQFEDVAYFVPFYLKDFVAKMPRKLL